MATESIRVSGVVSATPERVYEAWLTSREHGAMTGGKATVDATVGGAFTAWDGYIWGRNFQLEPGVRIVQSWRTSEFPKDAPDSRVEILFEAVEGGTRITFVHSEIPESQGAGYRDGWRSFYLEPMAKYFEQAARPTQILDAEALASIRAGERPKPLAKAEPKKTVAPAARRKAAKVKAAKAKAVPAGKKKAAKAKGKAKPTKTKTKTKTRTGTRTRTRTRTKAKPAKTKTKKKKAAGKKAR